LKKIKSSFIGKAFFSLIILYFVVFLFLFVFQSVVFRTYYTQRKVNELKNELGLFLDKDSYSEINYEELQFSQETNTFTSIIPLDTVKNNLDSLDISIIEIRYEDKIAYFYTSKISSPNQYLNQPISATGYEKSENFFIPTFLSINNDVLIRKNNSTTNQNMFSTLIDIDSESIVQIRGTVSKISHATDPVLNPIISKEVFNIISQNYLSMVNFEDGSYYFTNSGSNRESNLVFFSEHSINDEEYLIISVYPMRYIDEIVIAAGRANVYMFIIVLVILVISAFVYSREFSRPLLFINKKTKDLSKLDFSNPLIEIDSSDEFSELAKNINTLSINLKTTLYQLNEQNKNLLQKMEKENEVESVRREFLQGMSHELKTPLAIIQASAEAIENNVYDTPKDQQNALQQIQKEVIKTKKMLSNMMNVYRLDSPEYTNQWHEVNIKELILEIDKNLFPIYNNKELSVNFDLQETTLLCDKDKMELIITNLFNNAIKYTPQKGRISIVLQNFDHMMSFKITNHGTTLKQDDMNRIFDPFYRVDKARSRNEGSTGLGLYIVNQTLKQYKSSCTVSSTSSSVTFEFEIEKSI
jgi:signal transduction histidine kinase